MALTSTQQVLNTKLLLENGIIVGSNVIYLNFTEFDVKYKMTTQLHDNDIQMCLFGEPRASYQVISDLPYTQHDVNFRTNQNLHIW